MSLTLNKWCYYSTLTTRTKHRANAISLAQCQQLNKRKHAQTCVRAMFGTDGDDFRAFNRIVKLNSAIQNRSVREFVDLACDECIFLFKSLPPFDFLSFCKSVFDLLHAVLSHNSVTFVIRPTADEGFDIGVRWNLASKDHNVPLALGCNIHTSHVYKGSMMLRKANHIIEYLSNIGKLSQKAVDLLLDKIVPKDMLEGKTREAFVYILASLVVMLIYYALMQKLVS